MLDILEKLILTSGASILGGDHLEVNNGSYNLHSVVVALEFGSVPESCSLQVGDLVVQGAGRSLAVFLNLVACNSVSRWYKELEGVCKCS